VRARFTAALERVAAAGLLETLRQPPSSTLRKSGPSAAATSSWGRVPFLDDEACSIHAERPLACREFLVTSAAKHCAQPSDRTVERVPLPAQNVSRRAGGRRARDVVAGWTTLLLALEHAAQVPDRPERPSLVWLSEVFSEISGTKPACPKLAPLDGEPRLDPVGAEVVGRSRYFALVRPDARKALLAGRTF